MEEGTYRCNEYEELHGKTTHGTKILKNAVERIGTRTTGDSYLFAKTSEGDERDDNGMLNNSNPLKIQNR